jgi:hypothetical protein
MKKKIEKTLLYAVSIILMLVGLTGTMLHNQLIGCVSLLMFIGGIFALIGTMNKYD